MASTYLQRTNSSPTNAKKYTWSSWNKIDSINWYPFFSTTHQGGHSYIGFGASSSKHFGVIEHGDTAGTLYQVATSSIQADSTGWYHVVVQFDSTQSTASDRVKLYINNVLQTSFVNNTYPSQNLDSWFVDATTIEIGRRSQGSGQYYSGLISHAHFIDGTVYAPSTFGETDNTTGEWKIKADPGISTANYGNNGFWMFKDNNSLNDNSGNGNNFTLGGGTLTKTEDCPSNIFATLNPLNKTFKGSTSFNYGNTEFRDGGTSTNYSYAVGTIGANSGKFYWETKVTDLAEIDQVGVALASANVNDVDTSHGLQATNYGGKGCQFSNGYKVGDGSGGAYMGGFSANDIMMIALDLDNNKITFGRNGQWADGSGNANQTYANSTPAYTNLTAGEFYVPAQAKRAYGSNYGTNNYNFGNGYFGTTAVSSAGTNASGIGIFEYDVPTGFTALSTKGLNL
jgi:hypothetical protein